MFNKNHYVPILKWKKAEMRALSHLDSKDKKEMTPLIELVLPTVVPFKDKEQTKRKTDDERVLEMVEKFKEKRLKEIPVEILETWGKEEIFVDFSLIYDNISPTNLKINSWKEFMPAAKSLKLKVVPVVNLNDVLEIKKAISSILDTDGEVCVRVQASDLDDVNSLNKKLNDFVNDLNIKREQAHLLIDLKEVKEKGGSYVKYSRQVQAINEINKWKNLIIASGAFPEDLSKCRIDQPSFLPRFDWINWIDLISSEKLIRVPIFSDYTIRNPIFDEKLQYFKSTTSIKYTLKKDFYILKGNTKTNTYLDNAKLLVEDSGEFFGESFSSGDKGIVDKVKHYHENKKDPSIKKKPGNATDWISMSINHHFKVTLDQLSTQA